MPPATNGATQAALLQNPEVQDALKQQGMQLAEEGYAAAKAGALKGLSELNSYVQSGPAGVSMLCFLTGCATSVVGILGLINVFGAVTSPFSYLLNVYMSLFGIVSFLLECDVERINTLPLASTLAPYIHQYQELVFEYAKFLTELKGRGLFYLFVGTLAITQFSFLLFIVGAANLFVGVVCIMMGFGMPPPDVSPDAIRAKYERLQTAASSSS